MTNRPKAIGTTAETAVTRYLQSLSGEARRVAQTGEADIGDVHWTWPSGTLVVVQVKGGKAAEDASPERVAAWCETAALQSLNARRGDMGGPWFVVTKRKGVGPDRARFWRAHTFARVLGLRNVPKAVVSMNLEDMAWTLPRI